MTVRLIDNLEKESDDEDEDDPIENVRQRCWGNGVRLERDVGDEKNDKEEISDGVGDGVGDVSNGQLYGSHRFSRETSVVALATGKQDNEKEGKKKHLH